MTITHIELSRYSIPMHPFTIATGTMHEAGNLLVRIHTNDAGITGWGECSPFPVITGETQGTCIALARELAAAWIGKDPLDIPARMQELHDRCAGNPTAKSAFDMALYDIAAKNAGLPLYRFLGGQSKELETDITIGIGRPEDMAAQAAAFAAKGATIIKIKLGKHYLDDIERVKLIRQQTGPGMILRLDANQGWTFDEAVAVLNAVATYDIQFCEQPMRKWLDHRLPELRERSPIRIMADESCYDHHDAERLIRTRACDYINIKLAKSGGILEALRIHEVAQAGGIPCMLGAMLESKLAVTANLHLACACEGIVFLDQDSFLLGHLEDPVLNGARYNGMKITLPDLPGIGAEVEDAFLQRCKHWTISHPPLHTR